jgi:hypothetical protein
LGVNLQVLHGQLALVRHCVTAFLARCGPFVKIC